MIPTAVLDAIAALPVSADRRRLVALAGPPACGKSTFAAELARITGGRVVPMDGFHLDNAVLSERGLLAVKGAPETFDAAGFAALIARLAPRDEVAIPVFDRTRDIAIAGADIIAPHDDLLIIEGNYLLFDHPDWRDLAPLWDLSIRLNAPIEVLRNRLVQRWLDHGFAPDAAAARAEGNDLANAMRIKGAELPADLTI